MHSAQRVGGRWRVARGAIFAVVALAVLSLLFLATNVGPYELLLSFVLVAAVGVVAARPVRMPTG